MLALPGLKGARLGAGMVPRGDGSWGRAAGSPVSATRPPASWRSHGQALSLPTSAPAPHEAAVILTCHLNEKGERVEVQEEEEDVLILFSLPVSSMKFQMIQATKSLLAKSLLT